MAGYQASEVCRLLAISPVKLRSFIDAGFLLPKSDDQEFSFQDLILLRTAKELSSHRVSLRRIKRALEKMRAKLPVGQPLTAMTISAEGNRLTVRDGKQRWNPENGQLLFNFDVAELAEQVAPIEARWSTKKKKSTDNWFDRGLALEDHSALRARTAYEKAIADDPTDANAYVNLGRLFHESKAYEQAERHYRTAIDREPGLAIAHFNLGVVYEDQNKNGDAIDAYETAIHLDASLADAHFNLSRLYEQVGHPTLALRYLRSYRRLIDKQPTHK